jgi:hypothetical protein
MTRTHTEGNAQRAAWLLASHRVLSRTPLPFDRAAARRADRDPFDVTLLLEHPCLHRCRSRRCRSRRCRSRRCRLHRRAFIDVVLIDGQAQRERQPLSVVLLRLAGMPRSSILLPSNAPSTPRALREQRRARAPLASAPASRERSTARCFTRATRPRTRVTVPTPARERDPPRLGTRVSSDAHQRTHPQRRSPRGRAHTRVACTLQRSGPSKWPLAAGGGLKLPRPAHGRNLPARAATRVRAGGP